MLKIEPIAILKVLTLLGGWKNALKNSSINNKVCFKF